MTVIIVLILLLCVVSCDEEKTKEELKRTKAGWIMEGRR